MKKTMTRDELLNVRLVQQAEGTEFYRIPALNYTGVCTDGAPWTFTQRRSITSFFFVAQALRKW